MTEIKQNDITFVVAGPVHEGGIESSHNRPNTFRYSTKEVLQSIRKYYPEAKILLSTWEGSNTQGLEFDQLVLSKDPGISMDVMLASKKEYYYNNNQRVSATVLAGLKKVTTKYVVRTRTDILCTNNLLVQYYEDMAAKFSTTPNPELAMFKQRILTMPYITSAYKLFTLSDIFHFGLTEDLIKLWHPIYDYYQKYSNVYNNIDHPKYKHWHVYKKQIWEEYLQPWANQYFLGKKFNTNVNIKEFPITNTKFSIMDIEQLFLTAAMEQYCNIKHDFKCRFQHITPERFELSIKVFVNNFIIANLPQIGFSSRFDPLCTSPNLINNKQLYKYYLEIKKNNTIKIPNIQSWLAIYKQDRPQKNRSIMRKLLYYRPRISIMHIDREADSLHLLKVRTGDWYTSICIISIFLIHRIYRALPIWQKWHIKRIKSNLDKTLN